MPKPPAALKAGATGPLPNGVVVLKFGLLPVKYTRALLMLAGTAPLAVVPSAAKVSCVSVSGLAGPVVVAELGWMAMVLVDTILVGPLGPRATGAVGLGSNLYMGSAIFGMGLLLGLDTMISHDHGAGEHDQARRSLGQGVLLALGLTPLLMLLLD